MNDFTPEILYEDNHLIAVNKPAGILVQGDATGDMPLTELMKSFIKKRDDKPGNVFMGLIHRLDRPVSGLVLLAKTSKALERMNKKFQTREVKKIYLALVEHIPESAEGTLVHFLLKNEAENTVKAYKKQVPGAKEAMLDYRIIEKIGKNSLLEVTPHTGRSHQIRVQLSTMGTPIVGDTKYGSKRANQDFSICLHAYQLQFQHPVTLQPINIEAPKPSWAVQ